MLGRKLTRLGLVIGVLSLIVPSLAWAQGDNIGNSALTGMTPDPIPPGAVQVCFTVNVQSDDFEYMDRFDVDLPDHWIVDTIYDSVPAASGCSGALPPVTGTDAGNVVYWQSAGSLPTGCGAWNGGSAPGIDYTFCADVTVPDPRNEPWSFDWNIIGDTFGNDPHSAAGTWGPVPFDYGDPMIELVKTVGTTPGVCAATAAIDVLPGTDVYYCYTVTNPTFYTFQMHDLLDDQLGVLFADWAYDLDPLTSYEYIEGPVAIWTDTTNEGTWTSRIGNPLGYDVDDTVTPDYEDLSSTGTAFTAGDDTLTTLPIGFSFEFYGETYTEARVGSNGFLTFLSSTATGCCSGQDLPNPTFPNGLVAGWWDDLDCGNAATPPTLFYETLGSAPNRRFVVQFADVDHYPSGNQVTLEYKLFEGSNVVEVHYVAAPNDGSNHTAGIENQDGTVGFNYYRGADPLPTPLAIRYTPAGLGVEASAMATASVNVTIPDINVSPLSMASTLPLNSQETRVLNIHNDGDLALRWEIGEEYTSLLHPGGTSRIPPANEKPVNPLDLTGDPSATYGRIYKPAPIDRGESPDALLTITHSATQNIVTANSVSCNNGVGHTDNSYLRAFDLAAFGITGAFDVTEVEIGIENATGLGGTQPATVNLYTWDPVDPFQFAFFTPLDSASVAVADQAATILTVPIFATVPAGSVLVVEFFTPDGEIDGNLLFVGSNPDGQTAPTYLAAPDCGIGEPTDTAAIGFPGMMLVMNVTGNATATVGCLAPSDIPWLSLSADLGTTPGGGTSMIDVTFSSNGVFTGDYTGNLCIASNDPDVGPGNHTELVVVPVSLSVIANPAIALNKTVGTVPAVCAATDSVTVSAGDDVYFCYEVTNVGDIAFPYHTLVDDQLGGLLANAPQSLPPGASFQYIEPATATTSVVNTGTWTAKTSADGLPGYVYDDTYPYSFVDISATGTGLGLGDDGEANVTLPFAFTYYGVTSSDLRVGNNGGILFDATSGDLSFSNRALPRSSPALSILPFWDDIGPGTGTGDVYWEVQGTAPNRMAIIEWYNRPHYSNVGAATFEVILFEGTNQILFQYADVDFGNPSYDFGASATVGLNQDSSTASQYSYNTPALADGMAIMWTWGQYFEVTAADTAEVIALIPNIDVSPLALDVSLLPDRTALRSLDIANTGEGNLGWDILEENLPSVVLVPGGGSGTAPRDSAAENVGSRSGTPDVTPPVDYVSSADFSEGFDDITVLPGAGWSFQNLSNPLGTLDWFQGDDAVFPAQAGPATSYAAANFNSAADVGTISNWMLTPEMALNDGDTISFWTRTPTGSSYPDRLEVRLSTAGASTNVGADETSVGDFTTVLVNVNPSLTVGGYPEVWTQFTAVLSGIPSGATGRIGFRYYVTDAGPRGSNSNYIGIDTFEYTAFVGCLSVAEIPWLSASPTMGSTPAGTFDTVGVTFDTTGMAVGMYNANLCVESNDPDPGLGNGTELVPVRVSLEVLGEGAYLELTKTVGTTPAVCAATDNITVTSGTTVYYCFVAENTGTVTFNYHDLDDDVLGEVLNNFNYTLAPGMTSPEVIVPHVVAGPTTNTATWTAADAIGGYMVDDTIGIDYEDISATGTPITLGDDELSAALPIGFSFDFYGTSYSNAYISSNGYLTFDGGAGNGCCSGDPIPTPDDPNAIVAGWWEDLDAGNGTGAALYYETLGTAPNRRFVFQFENIEHYPSGNFVTLEYKLFESTGVVEVHYQAAPSDGGNHTAGVENADGTIGVQYYYGAGALTTPIAVRYAPSDTMTAFATDSATVNVSDPDIDVDPMSLLSAQNNNVIMTLPLDVNNVGTADLNWTLEEAPPLSIAASDGSFQHGDGAPSFGPAPTDRTSNPSGEPADGLRWLDGRGTVAYSTNAAASTHVWFDADAPGTLNIVAPSTGTFWAGDFVGADLTKTYQIKDTNSLVTIDVATGAETVIGTLAAPPGGQTYTGMTYDPITGNVYATSCDITTSSLIQINVVTATATVIGPISNSPCSIAIAATDDGQLYSYDIVNDSLLSINKTTGAGTIIGSIGFDANFGQGMDFDSATGAMFMSAFNNTSFQAELRIVDLATGNSSLVGALGAPGVAQLGWVAFAASSSACTSPADVPWLSVNPVGGTVSPAGTTTLDVSFDSTGYGLGIYEGVLCIHSNDPDEPLVEVPVTMDVLIPVELQSFSIE